MECVMYIDNGSQGTKVHRHPRPKRLATPGIFLSMDYLNIYILKKESSLFALHTRDFLASLNSKGF